jgi:Ca2+-binding EF-hand superfamily protein
MDLDGDGRLSRREVAKAMGDVLGEADLNDLLEDLDTDQNGEVEWHEFLNVMKIRMREPESVKMLKEAFRYYHTVNSRKCQDHSICISLKLLPKSYCL